MLKKVFIVTIGAALCLVLAGVIWLRAETHLGSKVAIKFVGLTNNSAAMVGFGANAAVRVSGMDKFLAVFSVTNRTGSPIGPTDFYYIEVAGYWWTYAPLGAGGQIPPHGSGTIVTRIPTNGVPWRVVVPYSRTTLGGQIAGAVGDTIDRALDHPACAFDRYGKGAPVSDWVKP